MKSYLTHVIGVWLWCLLLAVPNGVGDTVYVWSGGSHTEPYDTWATAANGIQTAVDYAAANSIGLVQLTNQTFTLSSQISISSPLTLRGESREGTILLSGGGNYRALNVNHANAVVESLTVTNFVSGGDGTGIYLAAGTVNGVLVTRCTVNNANGAGIYVGNGGIVTNSVFADNGHIVSDWPRGQVYIDAGGLVTHSVIRDSGTSISFGNVYMPNGGTLRWSYAVNNQRRGVRMDHADALVEYCVITSNVAIASQTMRGMGVEMTPGTLRNSLVADNYSTDNGGGVYMTGGLVESCTIADNESGVDGGGLYAEAGTIRNTIIHGNTASITGENNLRLGSATITYSLSDPKATGEGNLIGDPVFVGAGDYSLKPWSPCIDQGTNQTWMTTDTTDLSGTTNRILDTIVDIGAYEQEGAAFPDTMYVSSVGNHVYPYATWQDAATNIAAAVADAIAGVTSAIVLTNATYVIDSTITVDKYVTLRGLDRDTTIILGPGSPTALRGFTINHPNAALESLTVTNFWGQEGGGIYLPAGTVNDVLVTGCSSGNGKNGAGIYVGPGGIVTNSVFAANSGISAAEWPVGAVFIDAGGLVTHSVIRDSGSYLSFGNVYLLNGGTLRRSSVINNLRRGVRINHADALVEFCIITNNTSIASQALDGIGVDIRAGTLRNCLIVDNRSTQDGGGVYMGGGLIESCTIADNQSGRYGGGLYATAGTIRNTIIYDNTADQGSDHNVRPGSATITYSLSVPLPAGTGNLDGNPMFVGSGDYSLEAGSPCINQGLYQSWMDDALDLAGNRRLREIVDMGAYESAGARGSLLRMR